MHITGENLDAVTIATDSFKMADVFPVIVLVMLLHKLAPKHEVSVCDRVECEWVDFRECMIQVDGLLWGLNRRLLIREMLQ